MSILMSFQFRNNNNNERNSYIAKSIDGGISFIATADMDDYNWMLNACPATTPRGVVVDDSLVVVKRSGATGNNEIVCSSVNMIDLNYSYNNNVVFIIVKPDLVYPTKTQTVFLNVLFDK